LLILHYDASSGSIGDRSLLLVEPTQNGPKIVGEAERDFLAAAFLSRRYDPDLDIEQLPRDEQLVKQTDRLIGLLKDGEVEALRDMFVDHHAWHGVEDLLVEIMQTREVEAHIGKVMVNHLYGKGISVLEWVMPEGSGLREPPALRLRWERTPEGWVIAGVAMPDRFFLWLATEGDPFEE
jgi:hypothetical protein